MPREFLPLKRKREARTKAELFRGRGAGGRRAAARSDDAAIGGLRPADGEERAGGRSRPAGAGLRPRLITANSQNERGTWKPRQPETAFAASSTMAGEVRFDRVITDLGRAWRMISRISAIGSSRGWSAIRLPSRPTAIVSFCPRYPVEAIALVELKLAEERRFVAQPCRFDPIS